MFTLSDQKTTEARELLSRLEWCGTDGAHCPECGGRRPANYATPVAEEGHGIDCKMAAMLDHIFSGERFVPRCTIAAPLGVDYWRRLQADTEAAERAARLAELANATTRDLP